jgi:hypothetical protein
LFSGTLDICVDKAGMAILGQPVFGTNTHHTDQVRRDLNPASVLALLNVAADFAIVACRP